MHARAEATFTSDAEVAYKSPTAPTVRVEAVTDAGLYLIWLGPRMPDVTTTPSTDTHYYYGGRSHRCQDRWGQHHRSLLRGMHKNRHMQAVFDRHKVFEPVLLVPVVPEPEQMVVEQQWIDAHYGKPGCVNLSNSANTGWPRGRRHTEETRQKLREKRHSPETRKYLSAIFKGRPISSSHRAAIKAGHAGLMPSPQCLDAAAQANRNRVWTEAMRQRHAEARRGCSRSTASIQKQQETWRANPENVAAAQERAQRNRLPKGSQKSAEARKKLSEAAKRRCASPEARRALSARASGRVWVTDGTTCRHVVPEEVHAYLAKGWRRGRPTRCDSPPIAPEE